MAERTLGELAEVVRAREALHCLHLELPEVIVKDVQVKVEAAFARLRALDGEIIGYVEEDQIGARTTLYTEPNPSRVPLILKATQEKESR